MNRAFNEPQDHDLLKSERQLPEPHSASQAKRFAITADADHVATAEAAVRKANTDRRDAWQERVEQKTADLATVKADLAEAKRNLKAAEKALAGGK